MLSPQCRRCGATTGHLTRSERDGGAFVCRDERTCADVAAVLTSPDLVKELYASDPDTVLRRITSARIAIATAALYKPEESPWTKPRSQQLWAGMHARSAAEHEHGGRSAHKAGDALIQELPRETWWYVGPSRDSLAFLADQHRPEPAPRCERCYKAPQSADADLRGKDPPAFPSARLAYIRRGDEGGKPSRETKQWRRETRRWQQYGRARYGLPNDVRVFHRKRQQTDTKRERGHWLRDECVYCGGKMHLPEDDWPWNAGPRLNGRPSWAPDESVVYDWNVGDADSGWGRYSDSAYAEDTEYTTALETPSADRHDHAADSIASIVQQATRFADTGIVPGGVTEQRLRYNRGLCEPEPPIPYMPPWYVNVSCPDCGFVATVPTLWGWASRGFIRCNDCLGDYLASCPVFIDPWRKLRVDSVLRFFRDYWIREDAWSDVPLEMTAARVGLKPKTVREIKGVREIQRAHGALIETLALALHHRGLAASEIVRILSERAGVKQSERTIRRLIRRGQVADKHASFAKQWPPSSAWSDAMIEEALFVLCDEF
jgi:hypothetical protein